MDTKLDDPRDDMTATAGRRYRTKLLAASSPPPQPNLDDIGLATPTTRRRYRAALLAGSTLPDQLARARLVSDRRRPLLSPSAAARGGGCGRQARRRRPCGSAPIGWLGASVQSSTGPASGPLSTPKLTDQNVRTTTFRNTRVDEPSVSRVGPARREAVAAAGRRPVTSAAT